MSNDLVVEKVKKRSNRYLVTMSSGDEYSFSEDEIVNYQILKDKSFTIEEFNEILSGRVYQNYFDKAARHIDYKARTKYEITRYLISLGARNEELDEVIKKLESIGFINDEVYTSHYVELAIINEDGPNAISNYLLVRGIDKDLISKYLSKYTKELMASNAGDIANKTLKKVIGLPVDKQKLSVYSRLIRLGYPSELIYDILNKLSYSSVDLKLLQKEYDKLACKGYDSVHIFNKLLQKGYCSEDINIIIKSK